MKKRIITLAASVLGCLIFLTGCNTKELEDRQFALAASFDLSGSDLEVIYAFPNLSEITQQEQSQYSYKYNNIPKLTGATMEDIQKIYYQSTDKYLDYGHLKAVILSEDLIKDTEKLTELLKYFEDNELIARNALLFITLEAPEQIMALNNNTISSIGEYLNDMYKNNPYQEKETSVSLGDLLNHWHNQEYNLQIPIIEAMAEKPVIVGEVTLQKLIYQNE